MTVWTDFHQNSLGFHVAIFPEIRKGEGREDGGTWGGGGKETESVLEASKTEVEKRDSQGGRKREKKGIIMQHSQLKKPKEEGANENGGGGDRD